MDKEVREIARKVRVICKRFAMSDKSVRYDFHGQKDLHCMCLCASQVLRHVLKLHGIKSELWMNNEHAWVVVNGYVVDITYSQYIKRKSRKIVTQGFAEKLAFYVGGKRFYRPMSGWPSSQRFSQRMVEELAKEVMAE